MKFSGTFYDYQEKILNVFRSELDRNDKKIHLVAPPGSGKTILGIEIMTKLFLKKEGVSLILVPNTVLQEQWRDKINTFFIEHGENVDELVSVDMSNIKKINILTYQSVSQSVRDSDFIEKQVFELWEKSEGYIFEDFDKYIINLKFDSPKHYKSKFKSYLKKIKKDNNSFGILTLKVKEYFTNLKKSGVSSIVLDEAHHLTSWWSKVVFDFYALLSIPKINKNLNLTDEIYLSLNYDNIKKEISPYIVGLTATPPFDDVDYFTLDQNYINLLGEVDYYIPTPAVIKSGKLAPYNDLVQFVELPENHKELLLAKINKLEKLILNNKKSLKDFFGEYLYLYNKKIEKDKRLPGILAFCNIYLDLQSSVFDLKNFNELNIDDISYSLSLWLREEEENIFQRYKKVLYELGYVWKKTKFVKFFSFIDKLEIYNPEKIKAVVNILDKEKKNLSNSLRAVIISDFLDDVDGLLDCKLIFRNLKNYSDLNPVLVSGQGIWKLDINGKLEELNINILEVTKDFDKGNIKLLVGTRGILGEGWDSTKVNTLIDLTGISSFMSTNQVRGRAIRLDKENEQKVSNIYDIVTVDKNNILFKDFKRLEKKHNQVYGVDDSGLTIKGINHIFQDLKSEIKNIKKINKLMLSRSEKRNYFYSLWGIGDTFENKEQFILQLKVSPNGKYFPKKISIFSKVYLQISRFRSLVIKEIGSKTYYDSILEKYINTFLLSAKGILIKKEIISVNFSYKLILEGAGNFKIIGGKNSNEFELKKFMEIVSKYFSPVLEQRYLFLESFYFLENGRIRKIDYYFPLPKQLSINKKTRFDWFYLFEKPGFLDNHYKYEILRRFIYLQSEKNKYLGYQSFIYSEIEKIWI